MTSPLPPQREALTLLEEMSELYFDAVECDPFGVFEKKRDRVRALLESRTPPAPPEGAADREAMSRGSLSKIAAIGRPDLTDERKTLVEALKGELRHAGKTVYLDHTVVSNSLLRRVIAAIASHPKPRDNTP